MASVSSLDADMRNLRMSRYTPQAADEARTWIERALDSPLPAGDLLEALKDGVALCKLANLATQSHNGAIKFKTSKMPFIQMENISHFLKACEMAPLNMPAHDRFLTVDLFEQKDPAQVLQCLSAFSRQANKIDPNKFPNVIGPKKSGSTMSPATTGSGRGYTTNGSSFRRAPSPTKNSFGASASSSSARPMSPNMTGGSNSSHYTDGGTKSPTGPVSSWSKKSDENSSNPAWNIHQYGFMGGASQGNQGINFGAPRQITAQSPAVPSLAAKEKERKEKEAEAERLRREWEEEQKRKQRQADQEEERAKLAEEHKWEEETRRQREEEKRRIEDQKREWAEQERKWNQEEEARKSEDAALQATMSKKQPPGKPRVPSSSVLRGQTLADYQQEQARLAKSADDENETPEKRRVRELEQQLEEARERERQYQAEREQRLGKGSDDKPRSRPTTAETTEPERPASAHESDVSWVGDEREYSRHQWQSKRDTASPRPTQTQIGSTRPLPSEPAQSSTQRPLPSPANQPSLPARTQQHSAPSPFSRPLPTPSSRQNEPHQPDQRTPNRTDTFLAETSAPTPPRPQISSSREAGDTSLEQSQLHDARIASQQKTKAGAFASKSLLEREMERERERQREWESNQQNVAASAGSRDLKEGSGEGQSWDVNQYGWTGGDGQNKGSGVGSGINFGGRRQIIGPREARK